jgi:hypothetical protein
VLPLRWQLDDAKVTWWIARWKLYVGNRSWPNCIAIPTSNLTVWKTLWVSYQESFWKLCTSFQSCFSWLYIAWHWCLLLPFIWFEPYVQSNYSTVSASTRFETLTASEGNVARTVCTLRRRYKTILNDRFKASLFVCTFSRRCNIREIIDSQRKFYMTDWNVGYASN